MRYLFLICKSTIDLAEAIVSYLNLRQPFTYGEIFEILEEEKLISPKLSLKMKKMVGFRNILTHAYGEISLEIVDSVLKKDINDIFQFLKVIEKIA